jgi:hypothetical protein
MKGILRHKRVNGLFVGMPMRLLFFISLLIILKVSPSHHSPSTIAIKTRSAATKEKPFSRSLVATAATPLKHHQGRRSEQLTRSPQTSNGNNHLAKIKRPTTRLKNALKTLRANRSTSTNDPNNNLNAPCNLMPPTDKTGQRTTFGSPMGVDDHEGAFHTLANILSPQVSKVTNTQTTPPSRSVQINETATLTEATANSPGGGSQGGCPSILLSSSTNFQPTSKLEDYDASPPNKGRPSKIYD